MNYRRLSKEELASLEKEFIDFLVVNGITALDWERLKLEEIGKADHLVDLFSEVVFEGIFRKAKFLEIKTQRFVHAYQCLDDKIILVGIESSHKQLDFLNNEVSIIDQLKLTGNDVQLFMTDKQYEGKREHELFRMTEHGCQISDGVLFKSLSLAYIENKKDA